VIKAVAYGRLRLTRDEEVERGMKALAHEFDGLENGLLGRDAVDFVQHVKQDDVWTLCSLQTT